MTTDEKCETCRKSRCASFRLGGDGCNDQWCIDAAPRKCHGGTSCHASPPQPSAEPMTTDDKCEICRKPKCRQSEDGHRWPEMLNPDYCRASMCHGHAANPTTPAVTQTSGDGIGLTRYEIRGSLRATSNPWNDYEEFDLRPQADGRAYLVTDVDRRYAEMKAEHAAALAAKDERIVEMEESFRHDFRQVSVVGFPVDACRQCGLGSDDRIHAKEPK